MLTAGSAAAIAGRMKDRPNVAAKADRRVTVWRATLGEAGMMALSV